jgi:deoxyribodipyrimidine photo-lyase
MTAALVWFRQDLRLADNPALRRALDVCERAIPVYIHSPEELGDWKPGAASNWWLHHSLAALDDALRARGSRLILRRGPSLDALRQLALETGASQVLWNRLYEPSAIHRDRLVKQALREGGLRVDSINAALLFEPWQIKKGDGGYFRVFTPFWKACLRAGLPGVDQPAPEALPPVARDIGSLPFAELGLLPRIPWDVGLAESWRVGEQAARRDLAHFVAHALPTYDRDRNRPDLPGTSRLSAHLHFGEIGPRQIVAELASSRPCPDPHGGGESQEVFMSEVGWREFAHHLLFHLPQSVDTPLDARFEGFQWASRDRHALRAWQRGRTGLPIVDAGMRELWCTGWMHNRVGMIVASLLTKNLLIPWQEGARWFWETLVDADLANNTLGWQWTAGCGADAAPYFRIFNPVLQGEKFDPEGRYVRRWVPEIAGLPDRYLNKPWDAPADLMHPAALTLGEQYPFPIVDLKETRARALQRYAQITKG